MATTRDRRKTNGEHVRVTYIDRQIDREIDRERERKIDRQIDRQRERDTHTHRERDIITMNISIYADSPETRLHRQGDATQS